MSKNNYIYKFSEKFFDDREKNAIVDLLLYKKCNNIFIGNYNPFSTDFSGSTFSYYVSTLLENKIKKIYVDIDKINDDEYVI